ncbi:IucA/IucC family protein [Legionella quateirensis]|uniref:FrgA protein n=1 Tax=Legionella quateirensis TaxID=45072 RepID=A0A378L0D2_9GAMM|nr:IucA/IucC family protein [Legionella quateirensis]KTD49206.1 FrgA protein [Legionella quateirensis]STY19301.1 siderophore biosynthetic protein, iron repressed FrgA [Legionella quateirensis]
MALAYGNFHELSHQIRFLLFEIGIGLPQNRIDYYITLAHRDALKRLQRAVLAEGLIEAPIATHHVHDLIEQVQVSLKKTLPASQFFQWDTIRDELDESIANDALAQAYKQCWNSQIRNEANGYHSLWSWMNKTQTAYETLLFLEQWGCTGNPYQPAFRAKTGLSRREVLQNSPEFQSKISIHWCALTKNKVSIPAQALQFNDLIAQEFPTEFLLWRERVLLHHLNPEDYYPLPVHPWQWRNQLQTRCSALIDNKSLVLLPHHQTLIPSMSFDTMLPPDCPRAMINLSSMSKTSCSSIAESCALNEQDTEVIRWINSLLKANNHYKNTFFLVDELSSIGVKDDTIPEFVQKKLHTSLRQNPLNFLKSNQKAVPFASLFSNSPLSNTPLIIEIIKESDLEPLNYLANYCRTILFGALHLMLKHGVILQAQQHQILVIFDDNTPRGIIYKDLEQIVVGEHVFFNTGEERELSIDARLNTWNLNLLSTRFIQNILQNNIKPWIEALNTAYPIPVNQLWSCVHQVIHALFNELTQDINPQLIDRLEQLILHEAWQHQCSFTMRLSSNSYNNTIVHEVNPFTLL